MMHYLPKKGADIEAEKNDARTALHLAAEHDDVTKVRTQLKRGADTYATNNAGCMPLDQLKKQKQGSMNDDQSTILNRTTEP